MSLDRGPASLESGKLQLVINPMFMLVNATVELTSSCALFSDDVEEQADSMDTAAKAHAAFRMFFFTLYPFIFIKLIINKTTTGYIMNLI